MMFQTVISKFNKNKNQDLKIKSETWFPPLIPELHVYKVSLVKRNYQVRYQWPKNAGKTFFNFSVNFQKYSFIYFNVTNIVRYLYSLSFH